MVRLWIWFASVQTGLIVIVLFKLTASPRKTPALILTSHGIQLRTLSSQFVGSARFCIGLHSSCSYNIAVVVVLFVFLKMLCMHTLPKVPSFSDEVRLVWCWEAKPQTHACFASPIAASQPYSWIHLAICWKVEHIKDFPFCGVRYISEISYEFLLTCMCLAVSKCRLHCGDSCSNASAAKQDVVISYH